VIVRSARPSALSLDGRRRISRARDWPSVFAGARDEPGSPKAAISGIPGGLAGPAHDEVAGSWITQELARETHELESHPSLAERLDALGAEPSLLELAAAPSESAPHVLGSAQAAVEERLLPHRRRVPRRGRQA
jgi:hypothetical protein